MLDHKQYIDSAAQSIVRTRNALFLLTAAAVVFLAIWYNDYALDWSAKRLKITQQAVHCLDSPTLTGTPMTRSIPTDCEIPFKYAADGGLAVPSPSNHYVVTHEDRREYQVLLDTYTKQFEDGNKVNIPVFGAVIDVNSLGIISTVMLVFLSWVLFTHLINERRCIEDAIDQAPTEGEKVTVRCFLDRQTFFSSVRGSGWIAWTAMMLSLAVQVAIVWTDYGTYSLGQYLVGQDTMKYIVWFEELGIILLAILILANTYIWVGISRRTKVERVGQSGTSAEDETQTASGHIELAPRSEG